ncbi:MAG: hypothetical protein LBS34_02460 [Rickettsiales bacterium]|jgi:hypothetical protein|nr:hypothetical protein [Rickettsiales bacterium]
MINKKNMKNLILAGITNSLILFEDTANINNVESEYINEYKFFSDEAREFIDKNFEKEMSKEPTMFNGHILGLVSFETYGGKMFVSYEKGDYKTFMATKNPDYRRFIEEGCFFMIPIGVGNIILTRDNKIITGGVKKKKKLPGGLLSIDDIEDEKIDLLHCAKREISEEIGNLEIYDSELIGVLKNTNCTFSAYHKTDYTSAQVLNIWNSNREKLEDGWEMENMTFIDNNIKSIGKVITSRDFSDSARISMKFHLKEHFGNYDYMNVKL